MENGLSRTFAFVLGIIAALPATATEIPEKGWEYDRLDDDHVVIHNSDQSRWASAIDPSTEGDIVVPSTLRSMQVVSIGEKAFYNCSKLTSVTIPEGVTNIADNAFYGCSSLTNVVFPTSLKSIGTYAFYNCSKLAAANFTGASLTIGTHAFRNCSSIRDLSFSGDLISIGECAFSGCTGLRDVSLAAKSVSTGKCAFSIYHEGYTIYSSACADLTNVIVRASDASIAMASFSGCTALRRVDLSAKSLAVGDRAFSKYNYGYWTSPCSALSVLTVDADSVTLGASSFSDDTSLQQVGVASSNLTFGASVFANCSALTNAVLVGTASATIGQSAFSSCSKLMGIELPVALKDVATNAFYQCTSLESIAFPTNVEHISYRAFDTCTALKSIGFAEGLKTIDAQAFYGCSSVENLAFPQSVETVGARAFEKCVGLVGVSFEEGNTNRAAAASVAIDERAFYLCSSLKDVKLPKALDSTGERAFSQCESLVSINLPTNLTDIAASAFEDCSALPAIALPATLKSVGNNAFFGCTSLTGFLIPTNNAVTIGAKSFNNTKYWNDYPSDLVVNNGYILGFKGNPTNVTLPDGCKAIPVGMFEGMTTLKSVTIPDSVTEIGARAFNGCSGITGLSFNSVTTIGNSAFEGCTSLASVKLSESLTAIPGNAFKDCTSLVSIFIPDAVASVGEYAFYNCASLATVTGGNGVEKVGDYAFAQCPKLQSFEFPNDVAYGDHVFQGCTWTEHVLFPRVGTLKDEYPATYASIKSVVFSSNMSIVTNGACAGCKSLAYVRIPDGVTTIGALAFDGCTSLASVEMSASVTSVETNSFLGCGNVISALVSGNLAMRDLFPASYAMLRSVDFVDGVTSLCASQFMGCVSLAGIDIPQDVTSVGAHAFDGCSRISEIALPPSVTAIAEGTFAGCKGISEIVIPGGVATIGAQAFEGCTSLASVEMSASVTDMASDSFKGCTAISSATISGAVPMMTMFPECYTKMEKIGIASDVTSLCDNLFSNCVALTSIEIPWTVTEIGSRAFSGCPNLTEVVVPEYVTTIGSQAFGNCTGLRYVDYLCPNPDKTGSAAADIYEGTRLDALSRVLPLDKSWQTTLSVTGAVPGSTALPYDTGWKSRPIVWWATAQSGVEIAQVHFSYNNNTGGGTNYYFRANAGRLAQGDHFPEDPVRANYTFDGWWTQSTDGEQIEEGVEVTGSVTYYAHWLYDNEDPEEEEGDPEEEEDPVEYDFTRANAYNGYLTDGDGVIGTVQINFAKGKTNRTTKEVSASATAYVQLLGESRVSLKGTLLSDGSATLAVPKSEREMWLEIGAGNADQLSGSFDDYEFVAYRDIFSSAAKDDKARATAFLKSVSGKYTAVLAAEGEGAFATGYAALSVNVGSKGKTKIAGTMPDGTSVSASMQLSVVSDGESDVGVVPVVAPMYSKKGGIAFLLTFEDGVPALSNVSPWIADKSGTQVSLSAVDVQSVAGIEEGTHGFLADISFLAIDGVDIVGEFSPDGTAFEATAKKWKLPKADTVKFVKDEGYVITKDNGNPAALKLTYTASTGMFSGSFKVYGVTSAGRSKTYTATVKGAVTGGVGYGTAVVKKVGSLPVGIE